MKAVASMVAMLAVTMAWTSSAEATEAHIESFEFSCVTPDGQTLKPKLGDIGGAFYTGLPEQREQCLEAVRNMIALCRENVDFESNTKNQEFAGCLPIFEEQAQACVGHFKFEQGKCDAGGIPDGTTESAQEDEPEPDDSFTIEPLDTVMDVTKRANVRAGPGTDYAVLGTLDPGVGVRVTGAVQGLDWFRVDLREDGGEAFIHASLLTARAETAPDDQGLISTLSPRCSEIQENVKCWKETVDNPGCFVWDDYAIYGSYADPLAWSGACSGGVGEGQGTLTWIETGGDYEESGMLVSGVRQGLWSGEGSSGTWDLHFVDGTLHGPFTSWTASGEVESKGNYVDGQEHGQWYEHYYGDVEEGPYVDGQRHGHWVRRMDDGKVTEGPYVDGERHGKWIWRYPDGSCSVHDWSYGDYIGSNPC